MYMNFVTSTDKGQKSPEIASVSNILEDTSKRGRIRPRKITVRKSNTCTNICKHIIIENNSTYVLVPPYPPMVFFRYYNRYHGDEAK